MVPVSIKHTSEVTIELGCGYFAEMKSRDAEKILERRL